MISTTSLAIAQHHLVAQDWISDPRLELVEVSFSEYTLSLGVKDAGSLRHAYDRLLKEPHSRPKITVFDVTEHGRGSFILLQGFYACEPHPDTEMVISTLITDPSDLDIVHSMEPGLALIEALAARGE